MIFLIPPLPINLWSLSTLSCSLFTRSYRLSEDSLIRGVPSRFPDKRRSGVFRCTGYSRRTSPRSRIPSDTFWKARHTILVVSRSEDDLLLLGRRRVSSAGASELSRWGSPTAGRFSLGRPEFSARRAKRVLDAPRSANDRDETKLYGRANILERLYTGAWRRAEHQARMAPSRLSLSRMIPTKLQ